VAASGVLAIATLQLLRLGARGAEIANVLQIPISVLTLLGALWAALSSEPSLDPRGKPVPQQPSRLWQRARQVLPQVVISVVVVIVLAITAALVGPAVVGRVRVWAFGCEHPAELRVLTSPDQLEPVRQVGEQFERWTAERGFGCPAVNVYVFASPAKVARDALKDRWSGTSLRDVGPVPDVWLATSADDDWVRSASADSGLPIEADDPIARSPVVLAAGEAGVKALGERPNELSWVDLVNRAMGLDWDLVRPDPAGTLAGQLGTAVVYGQAADMTRERMIEQRIGRSLDNGNYPLGGDLEILCRYRALHPSNTAAVVTEQAMVRFNNGDPLGVDCGSHEGDRLFAVYPADSAAVEYRFVRFAWGGSRQQRQAEAFGRWLTGDEGRKALVGVGLRPPGFVVGHPLSPDNGVQPEAIVKPNTIDGAALKRIMDRYQAAQRRGRVRFALDGSGSMGTTDGPAGQPRFETAKQGVLKALNQMGEADEFGLSIFSTIPATSGEVPVGPRDGQIGGTTRYQATVDSLNRTKPGGGTPLFRAVVDGVGAVGPSEDKWTSAVIVLTDGENTESGLTVSQVIDAVRGKGVRIFAVVVGGDATCSTVALAEVTKATGGDCVNAGVDSIDKELTELFGSLGVG